MASNTPPANGPTRWVRNVALASALFGGLSGALLGGCAAGIREMSAAGSGDSILAVCLGLGLIAGAILGAGAGALCAWLLKEVFHIERRGARPALVLGLGIGIGIYFCTIALVFGLNPLSLLLHG